MVNRGTRQRRVQGGFRDRNAHRKHFSDAHPHSRRDHFVPRVLQTAIIGAVPGKETSRRVFCEVLPDARTRREACPLPVLSCRCPSWMVVTSNRRSVHVCWGMMWRRANATPQQRRDPGRRSRSRRWTFGSGEQAHYLVWRVYLSGGVPWSGLFHSHGVYQHGCPSQRVCMLGHTMGMVTQTIIRSSERAYEPSPPQTPAGH
ncbi:hypothetical protein C8Q77DRAFT_801569 [Trametes polyzona]|nr:hypothetical protein C8Q77DRAFT_801569 [Trametes polyzona]